MTGAPNTRSLNVHYSAGAQKFHQKTTCPSFVSSRALWDLDPWDDYTHYRWPRPIHHATEQEALDAGRLPCLACLPGHPIPPSTDNYGHWPVTGFIDGRALTTLCARCRRTGTMAQNMLSATATTGLPVRWPCTSAIVLGLAPRLSA